MEKGAALNKRVSEPFEKAGFATEPGSMSAAEREVEPAPGKRRRVDLLLRKNHWASRSFASNKSGGVEVCGMVELM